MRQPLIDSSLFDIVWIDLDDTLIDFRANSRAALAGLHASTPQLSGLWDSAEEWTKAYEDHNHRLWAAYNRAEITRDTLRLHRFLNPLMEAGMAEDEARRLAPALDPAYLDLLAQQKRLVPGALALLERLRGAGLRCGVLSNGFKEVQYRKMDVAGLTPYIDLTVLSDDIGVNKPDARLYCYAMGRAGVTDPSRCVMIGDNPATDIEGALCAGWDAILFDPYGMLTAPTATVGSLDEIEVRERDFYSDIR